MTLIFSSCSVAMKMFNSTIFVLRCLKASNSFTCKYRLEACDKVKALIKVSKGAKIRNRYNQVPHLAHDTHAKVTNSQLDTTNKSQEASPFPAGDHKVHINRRAQRHCKHKTEKSIKDPQKK